MSPRSLLTAAVAATALFATAPAHAVGARDLSGTCTFVMSLTPDGQGVLTVAGHAEATGTAVAVATILRCVVTISTATYTVVSGVPGPAVALAGADVVTPGPVGICSYPSALWSDGVYTAAPGTCR